ncbi:hypothetical protein F2Q68_00033160 [Brassica cretica]|uniref:Uncharacterized protein n=1 Tax=Brassica cretica TaxID=69181 RepID=A0A8S9GBZ5_BRACR|nr:hypothetical protein F2Q68_00033160 [Brassica cretica]
MGTATFIDILLAILLPPLGVFLRYGCEEQLFRRVFLSLCDYDSSFPNELIRDRKSDKTTKNWTFEYTARYTVRWTAMASVIKADETWMKDLATVGRGRTASPVKIPPIPHRPELASHAASTLHTTPRLERRRRTSRTIVGPVWIET